MIRRNQSLINVLTVFLDIAIAAVCFLWLPKIIAFEDGHVPEPSMLLAFTAFQAFCYYKCGFYRSHRVSRFLKEWGRITKACLYACALLTGVTFITGEGSYDFTFCFAIMNFIILTCHKYAVRRILRFFRSRGYNIKHLVVVGRNRCTDDFIRKIQDKSGFGYKIIGFLGDEPIDGVPYLGPVDKIEECIETLKMDEIIITLKDDEGLLARVIKTCDHYGVRFYLIPDVFSVFNNNFYIYEFDGIVSVTAQNVPLENGLNCALKRAFDLVFSLLAFILAAPFMLAACVIVKITSKGPVIYRQIRMGLNRKEFMMYKFRSMAVGSDEVKMAAKDDERITPAGAFIRRFSIDELPQILNVLKGEMSWVGPRPEIPRHVEHFKDEIPFYMMKHYVKPGITGWAQVNGLRGRASPKDIEERIKYDMFYIENWSFSFDLKIIFMTLYKGIFNKNAY